MFIGNSFRYCVESFYPSSSQILLLFAESYISDFLIPESKSFSSDFSSHSSLNNPVSTSFGYNLRNMLAAAQQLP